MSALLWNCTVGAALQRGIRMEISIRSSIIYFFGNKYFRSVSYKGFFLQTLLLASYVKLISLSLERLYIFLALTSVICHI